MRTALLALLAAAALSACTPRQACLSAATRELGRIDALVAESERALALGYRTERVVRDTGFGVGLGGCIGRDLRFCTGTRLGTGIERRAIDPESERRTLAYLRARQSVLRQQAAAAAATCPA